jgi:hypothetical protein
MAVLIWICLFALDRLAFDCAEASSATPARQTFEQAKREYEAHPNEPEPAWHFARAAFDSAGAAANNTDRAGFAQQGITACKQALAQNTNLAQLHYYLALNQGQLARTRGLSALKLVDQMEVEFIRAIELDASFDHAGAERSLGMLYRDAPALASIGSRSKARVHIQRAVELAPGYPENRLILIESELKWGDRKRARSELKLLEDSWPHAHSELSGLEWAGGWSDWTERLEKVKKTLEEPARIESPHH